MKNPIAHCVDDGQLQAYLDEQLDGTTRQQVQQHMANCVSCRLRLDELRQLDDWFQTVPIGPHRTVSRPGETVPEPVDTEAAWHRFLHRLPSETVPTGAPDQPETFLTPGTSHTPAENPPAGRTVSTGENTDSIHHLERKKQMKKWTVTAAAILLGGALLANPGLRNAAAEMLHVFRVENLNTVKMPLEDLERIAAQMNNVVGEIDLRDYGTAEVLERPQHTYIDEKENPEQFAAVAASLPRLPSPLTARMEQSVSQFTGSAVRYTLDVENVNALIQALGGEKLLPQELDGESFLFTYPGGYHVEWFEREEDQNGNVTFHAGYQLEVRGLPSVETSAGLEIDAIQEALASLPFLSPEVKQQLRDIRRFTNTMLMPELLEKGEEKVTINGHPALYRNYGGKDTDIHELLWIADQQLIRFSAYDIPKDRFFEAAQNIQWPENG